MRSFRQLVLAGMGLAAFLLPAGGAHAEIELELVASGLDAPLYVTSAGDGSGRLFIANQSGRISIFWGGRLRYPFFLDIQDRIQHGGESGLIGLAFHPAFRANGRFFVYYTRNGPTGIESVVAEYRVPPESPDFADRESERIVLAIPQPALGHEGGMLAFGPDGFLYIGSGDGGLQGDPLGNGQNLETLLGKILRIDVDSGSPYAVPPDNPFVGRPGRDEIWAYGFAIRGGFLSTGSRDSCSKAMSARPRGRKWISLSEAGTTGGIRWRASCVFRRRAAATREA